jgi:hemolysin activation/secretion protein
MRPVSPLCLYAPEIARMTGAVVQRVKERGFVGIYLEPGDGAAQRHPSDGALRWKLFLATVREVRVVDRREKREPVVDLERARAEFPLKAGDHLVKPKMDGFVEGLRARLGCEVAVQVQSGEKRGDVVVTVILGEVK